jgi:hypothetical protein
MPRSPARAFTSKVASPPDTEIAASHFRQGRTSPPFPALSEPLRDRSDRRCSGPAVVVLCCDDDRAGEEVERLIRTAGFEPVKAGGLEQPGPARGGRRPSRSRSRPRRGAVIDRRDLIASPPWPGHLFGRAFAQIYAHCCRAEREGIRL